jgi:hypothetical protein
MTDGSRICRVPFRPRSPATPSRPTPTCTHNSAASPSPTQIWRFVVSSMRGASAQPPSTPSHFLGPSAVKTRSVWVQCHKMSPLARPGCLVSFSTNHLVCSGYRSIDAIVSLWSWPDGGHHLALARSSEVSVPAMPAIERIWSSAWLNPANVSVTSSTTRSHRPFVV